MRADAAAAPSSPTSLTAPLLLHARTEASPISGIGALPASKKFSGWRDHAVAILRGRANVHAMHPLDDAAMVSLPLLALPANADELLVSPSDSDNALVDSTSSVEQTMHRRFDPFDHRGSRAEPTGFLALHAVDQPKLDRPNAAITHPLTDDARRMTRFLTEVDGPHLYLNSIRSALRMRQQQPDFSRYLNDVLLGRWIAEYVDALSQAAVDALSVAEASACEEMENWQFKRLAQRLGYLDKPSLPVVCDREFAERNVGQASVTTVGEKSPMCGASIDKRLR